VRRLRSPRLADMRLPFAEAFTGSPVAPTSVLTGAFPAFPLSPFHEILDAEPALSRSGAMASSRSMSPQSPTSPPSPSIRPPPAGRPEGPGRCARAIYHGSGPAISATRSKAFHQEGADQARVFTLEFDVLQAHAGSGRLPNAGRPPPADSQRAGAGRAPALSDLFAFTGRLAAPCPERDVGRFRAVPAMPAPAGIVDRAWD
jgi:hypothetical protein